MADNWLTDGNCKECRRKNYCKNPCRRNKQRVDAELYNAIMSKTGLGKLMDAYKRD